MVETISQVQNEYVIAKEDTYGTEPSSPTLLDFGYIQSISVSQEENVEEVRDVSSGHTLSDINEGLYVVSGTITTWLSTAGAKNVFEALLGSKSEDTPTSGEFTVTTDPSAPSYFLKYTDTSGNIKLVTGLKITGGEVTVNRDGTVEISMDYQAQKVQRKTESISPITNVGKIYRGLDAYVTYNGNNTILQEFSFSIDWNYSDEDARGIESTTDKRTIQRVIRHNLSLSGSFDTRLDENIDEEYADERTQKDIVLNLDRNGYSQTFTIKSALVSSKEDELTTDDEVRTISCDFTGTDVELVGTSYSSS